MHVQACSSAWVSLVQVVAPRGNFADSPLNRFVLKTKEQRAAEKALLDKSPLKTLTLEEFLESERHKLTGKLTPVTPESFAEWKKKRLDKKAAEEQVGADTLGCPQSLHRSSLLTVQTCRPAKRRRQPVVPCSKAATGVLKTTTKPARTQTTETKTRHGTWRSCGRRRRPYDRRKRTNGSRRSLASLHRTTEIRQRSRETQTRTQTGTQMGRVRMGHRVQPLRRMVLSKLPRLHEKRSGILVNKILVNKITAYRMGRHDSVPYSRRTSRQTPGAHRMDAVYGRHRRESGRIHPPVYFLLAILAVCAVGRKESNIFSIGDGRMGQI